MRTSFYLFVACAPALLSGCVGQNRVGAFTIDNLGLSVESTTPNPQIDISYSRQEGAVEPVFEDGNTPTVAASVQHEDSAFKLSANIKSVFTTGNAAIYATGGDASKAGYDAVACIHTPVKSTPGPFPTSLYTAGQTGALFFGTDTIIGLKVSVSTGESPNVVSGKLGYNRQEVSFAPVFQKSDKDPDAACSHRALVRQAEIDVAAAKDDTKENPKDTNLYTAKINAAQKQLDWLNDTKPGGGAVPDEIYGRIAVFVPSTFASANDGISTFDAQGKTDGKLTVAQVFATGKAAELIAMGPGKGAISAVAQSISPPDKSSSVPGPTFVVGSNSAAAAGAAPKAGAAAAGGAAPKAAAPAAAGAPAASGTAAAIGSGIKVMLCPDLPAQGSFATQTTQIDYTTTGSDTPSSVAAALAKKFNSTAAASALGLQATAAGANIMLTIPKNLSSFFPSTFDWKPSSSSDKVTLTLQEQS